MTIFKDSFLGSLFYSSVSVLILVSYCFSYCSFVASIKIRAHKHSNFVLLFQDYFGYMGSLEVPCKFWIDFQFLQKKNATGILIDTVLIFWGSVVILTILSLWIHEHRISFPLMCLLWFLSAMFYNFKCTSFLTPWVNLFLSILFFLMDMFS